MRVLFASPFLNFPGHIRRFTVIKAQSMAQAGLDVTVYGYPSTFDEIEPHERLRYVSLQSGFSARWRERLAACGRRFGNFWLFLVEVGWVQWAALRYARQHRMDVTYIADVEPWLLIPVLWLARLQRQRPPVVGFISFLFHEKASLDYQPWFSRLRSRMNVRASLHLSSMMDIVSDCKYSVAFYVKVRPDRVHAIMEGYVQRDARPGEWEEARRKLNIPPGDRVLLHFGLVTPGKGTELLIEALRGIPPVFELYIVGKSGIYAREGLLDHLPVEWRPHVHVESRYVTEEERIQYFSACDGVILPYRYGFTGAGGNFRDAISFGKAIIASDQFLMGDMGRKYDFGILFKPDDASDLRRALIEFAQKPDYWFQGIAGRSRAIVEEFSWEKVGLRYRELFERLVAESGRPTTDDGRQYRENK